MLTREQLGQLYERHGSLVHRRCAAILVLPASTQVPLNLVGTSELDYLLCEADCAIAPTGGVRIYGYLTRSNGSSAASICLTTDGSTPIANAASASVQVNGQAISFSSTDSCFDSDDGSLTLNAPGSNTVAVTLDGHAPWNFQVGLPDDFSLQSPTEDQRVLTGSTLTAQWTTAPGAGFYELLSRSTEPPYTFSSDLLIQGNSGTTTMPSSPGAEWVAALALTSDDYQAQGLGGSNISAYAQAVTEVDVVAPDAISASGTLGAYRSNGGALSGFADVKVYSGATVSTSASVSVNGSALAYTPLYGDYELDGPGNFIVDGVANSLAIQVSGQPQLSEQVLVPSDFTVTNPPAAPVPAGSTLSLSWTASAGATGYSASIYGDADSPLAYVYTTGLSTSLSIPAQPGSYILYVVATGGDTGEDLYGQLQNELDLTVQ